MPDSNWRPPRPKRGALPTAPIPGQAHDHQQARFLGSTVVSIRQGLARLNESKQSSLLLITVSAQLPARNASKLVLRGGRGATPRRALSYLNSRENGGARLYKYSRPIATMTTKATSEAQVRTGKPLSASELPAMPDETLASIKRTATR